MSDILYESEINRIKWEIIRRSTRQLLMHNV